MTRQSRSVNVTARVAEAAELYRSGMLQSKIAKTLGVSPQSVCWYIARAKKEWRESATDSIKQWVIDELETLDRIEQEANAAWERSQKMGYESTTKDGIDGREVTVKRYKQVGEPRFLALMQECVAQRRKLLGLDAPTKTEVKDTTDNPVLPYEEAVRVVTERIKEIRAAKRLEHSAE